MVFFYNVMIDRLIQNRLYRNEGLLRAEELLLEKQDKPLRNGETRIGAM